MRIPAIVLALVLFPLTVAIAAPAGVLRMQGKKLSASTTGKVSAVEIDRVDVTIADAPPLGSVRERTVSRVARRPLRKEGRIDQEILAREAAERFRDFELCRIKVARLANLPLADVPAGQISVRWTILPTGRTRGTLLLEVTETDLSLMVCARRQMNRWSFTPPKGGPVEVEFDYDFSSKRDQ